MIISANQPYFLPYLGYWQLIACADTFLLGDDYAYIRKGWVNRNRILAGGRSIWLRMEVAHFGFGTPITDVRLKQASISDKLRTLEMAYHRASNFGEGMSLAERIITFPERNLAVFLEHSIREVCACLGIGTIIGRTSDLKGNSLLHREERIYDFCRRCGADTYVNAIGGMALYDFREFESRGLRLRFLRSRLPSYPQVGGGPFVPSLSILDAIMNNPVSAVREMLDEYDFVDG